MAGEEAGEESARGASAGPLGAELAAAIRDYERCRARATRSEAAFRQAQREVSEARARLTALATGARVTGSTALIVLDGEQDAADPRTAPDQPAPGA